MVEPPSDEEEVLENSFMIGQISDILSSSISRISKVFNYF